VNQPESLLSLDNASVRRGSRLVLDGLNFRVRPGECWAVTGPTGSGKTTLLQALAGQIPVVNRQVSRSASVGFVSFREESRQFSYTGHFYQQRYQATMSDEGSHGQPAPTLRDFLGLTNPNSAANAGPILSRLGLLPLLDRTLLKLSNGQTRKARIGKALLQHPLVLLLDNPFVGLDAGFRLDLTQWLGHLLTNGLTLVLVVDPEAIPAFVTHVAELADGTLRWSGPVSAYRPGPTNAVTIPVPELQTPAPPADFTTVFQLRNVGVRYGETVILTDVNWTIRPNERWALLGPNGAGKSVLLSLLYGDHPQAYANDICVFDHRRGRSGQSIWAIKRRIGFVSPELHLYFPQHLTARQVALTGLTDTLTPPQTVGHESEVDLAALFTYFGLNQCLAQTFGQLSAGQQRLILLIRALIKNPPVLILDEPFQALDAQHTALARQLIDRLTDKTVLFVTHDLTELPASIDRIFSL